PLFPLGTVLFHGGHLPLRIFEPRYLDMISRCMRQQKGFGVVLIRSGSDARFSPDASQPEIFQVGTEAEIIDFNQLKEGMLGIVARGRRKFRIRETYEETDHLLVGRVEFLPDEPRSELRPEHQPLVDLLLQLVKHPMVQQLNLQVDFDDSRSVGWRLAELLPNIEPEIKQSLLQLQWPGERLAELTRLVNKLRG
ncbi:MAG: LON peptidase substrate-binding domain-containing protein, partial [Proteobacteria bacterium]|nr:LON peptidase substrate-binding domain-containing protein [Pseudomonadota bacterium]